MQPAAATNRRHGGVECVAEDVDRRGRVNESKYREHRHSINEGDDSSSHAVAGCGSDGRKQGAMSPRAKGKMGSNPTKMPSTCFCISITMAQWQPASVRLWASVSALPNSLTLTPFPAANLLISSCL